ncbi:MAG: hypothetical protein J6X35_10510, partial [Bacteroidales bacterium]|nr:hypothetical protein [Bacteroidales bacterium]
IQERHCSPNSQPKTGITAWNSPMEKASQTNGHTLYRAACVPHAMLTAKQSMANATANKTTDMKSMVRYSF